MPDVALRTCAAPGCGALVRSGRCDRHALQKAMSLPYSSAKGYDRRWRVYSERVRAGMIWRGTDGRVLGVLCGDRPHAAPETGDSVCQREGRVQPAECIDHIVPVAGPNDPRLHDRSNHQALCNRCHALKRQRESLAARATVTPRLRAAGSGRNPWRLRGGATVPGAQNSAPEIKRCWWFFKWEARAAVGFASGLAGSRKTMRSER